MKNVPPSKNAETLGAQGFEDPWSPPLVEGATSKMYPLYPQNVPPFVPPEIRVEALSFGSYYVAVFRQDGQADDILDGLDGKPRRFDSAHAAIGAGKAHLVPDAKALQVEAKTFRADRNRGADEERRHVFANFRGAHD